MQQTNFKLKHITLAVLASLLALPFASVAEETVREAAAESSSEIEKSTAKVEEVELGKINIRATKDTGGLYQPANTTTGTKTNAPLRDIPQTINVVTKETWRDQGARSLNDTLHSVPGVSVLAGDGARDQVLIRGFSSQTDNLVDGFRDDATYFRDLANIERIEVIKGPASALYGRGGSGGLINRITKKPMFETLYEVGGIAGSYNVKRGEIDFNQPLSDTVAVRLAASVEDSESFRDQYFLERHLIAPSILFKPSDSTSLLFQIDYLDDRRVDDLGVPFRIGGPLNVKRSQYYGSLNAKKDDVIQTHSSGATISFDHVFDSGLKIRNVFRATDLDQDRNDTRAPGFTATTFTRQHTHILREDKGIFNQTDLMLDVDGFGMKHALLAGLELNHQDKDSWGSRFNVDPVNQLNPVLTPIVYGTATTPTLANFNKRWYTPLPAGTKLLSVSNTNHDTNTVGVYAQDLVTINPQWKVLAGLRYDQFKQDTTDYMRLKTDVRRNISRTDYTISPRVGVVYQPTDYASVYTSVSRSYQPTGIDGALSYTARDLEPERTTNYEVGAKLDLMDGGLSAQAALFSLERTNTRLTVNQPSGDNRQGGETRTNGLELSLAGRPADGWDIISAYTYLDSVIVKSDGVEKVTGYPDVQLQGNRVPMVAKHSANLWLTKRFANGFGLGGGVSSTGKRYITSGERAWMPGYTRFDATAFYEAKKYEVRLNVYNLFDLNYTDAATGGNENGAIPGVPLSALLSAKYRF
ncbi:MAG TPA: TonB-dependent siderophore receptor [Methylotenera sp.]|nr:TonB-dependent siderophore receptor [Methylotenera sp.]